VNTTYSDVEPKRREIDSLAGPAVVEFGSPWCGYCRAAQPLLARAFADHPEVQHVKIADASGKRLGRSFGVKLWPTLVFLRDGKEVARLVRPRDAKEISDALASIDSGTEPELVRAPSPN
jgi:thioredoxin 1